MKHIFFLLIEIGAFFETEIPILQHLIIVQVQFNSIDRQTTNKPVLEQKSIETERKMLEAVIAVKNDLFNIN